MEKQEFVAGRNKDFGNFLFAILMYGSNQIFFSVESILQVMRIVNLGECRQGCLFIQHSLMPFNFIYHPFIVFFDKYGRKIPSATILISFP